MNKFLWIRNLLISEGIFCLQRAPNHFHNGSAQEGVVVFALHQPLEDVKVRLIDERLENHDDRNEELLLPIRETDRHVAITEE